MADAQDVSRFQVTDAFKSTYDALGGWMKPGQLPLVYHPAYNIGFFGLERVHPFDSHKFRKIVRLMEDAGVAKPSQLVRPVEVTLQQLEDVHSADYLQQLHGTSRRVAQIIELPGVAWLPNLLVQNRVTKPLRHHVGGTMLAAALALDHGWAINIGGGMHHASFNDGGGWCAYDDLVLALRQLRRATNGAVQKCLLVDLDVHQGNGHERDKLHFKDDDLYILDVYGNELWPGDKEAKAAMNVDVGIPCGTADAEYLAAVGSSLERAFDEFSPDIILYNAGSDILIGDPLGQMRVTPEGVAERDMMVFRYAASAGVPICMALSGGYARRNFEVVGNSLVNLVRKFGLVDEQGAPQRLLPERISEDPSERDSTPQDSS